MSTKRPEARKRGPLRPAAFHILLALAGGERHGYAIKQEVERSTGGDVRLGPGTLYESIQRLRERGWIEEAAQPPPGEPEHAQRRYYRLTAPGRRVLESEVRRLEQVVALARVRLHPPEADPAG